MPQFGRTIQALTTFAAGLDQYAMQTLFVNDGQWSQCIGLDYRGGDSGEGYVGYLVPPNTILDGTQAPSDVPGCVAVLANMTGGDGSVNVPQAYGNYRPMTFQPFLIPPHWSLALQNASASNTNAVVLNILYVELIQDA